MTEPKISLSKLKSDLRAVALPEKAAFFPRFFKTGPGEYGEGDQFLGVKVPEQRKIAKRYQRLPLDQVSLLLDSPFHEERLTALFILIHQFLKGSEREQEQIFDLYVEKRARVNNWDLVDSSAHHILGAWLEHRNRDLLDQWARQGGLWERRIAIIATFRYLRQNEFADSLRIAEILLEDDHDLIHKAVGWTLREVGKRDLEVEKAFLEAHGPKMPRTALRYAIERFPNAERKEYLNRF